jgi:hypothetical protein
MASWALHVDNAIQGQYRACSCVEDIHAFTTFWECQVAVIAEGHTLQYTF